MDLRFKIEKALREALKIDYVRLEDDDGIAGFVVSPQFKGVSSLDRQQRIDDALNKAADPLSLEERRRVFMIAGLTPAEYEAVGARVRVHRVKEMGRGAVEILLCGGLVDASPRVGCGEC
jgi:acid stress-induced BolA-like protein IbaG/YrbA